MTARRPGMRLWVRRPGDAPLLELDGGDSETMFRRFNELKAEGAEVMMRPASETAAEAEAMFVDHDHHETISAERSGAGSIAAEEFGIREVDFDEVPEGVSNTHAWFGPNERDEEVEAFWAEAASIDLELSERLYSGQIHLSPTALAEMDLPDTDGPVVWPNPPRLVRADGKNWVLDGHHLLSDTRIEHRERPRRHSR